MDSENVSKQDQRARRCVSLMLYLADNPCVSLSRLALDLEEYRELGSFLSAKKVLLRDAAELSDMGVSVTEDADGNLALTMNLSTYADLSQLSGPTDVARLALVLSALLSDRTFLQEADLRRALAKILGHVGPSPVIARAVSPALNRYLTLIEERLVSHLNYRDANGVLSERVVHPLGLFELNGHTYLVADTLAVDGERLENGPVTRVYRDDRIRALRKASAVEARDYGKTFEVPTDFDASDWCVLPFQIGEPLGPVEFTFDEDRRRDVEARVHAARDHRWTIVERPDSSLLLRVDVCCSWEDAARWAIGMDLKPVFPHEVVDSYQELLKKARTGLLSLVPLAPTQDERPELRHRGRPLSAPVTSQLLTLLGLFAEPGTDVSLDEIAQALGVDKKRGRELVELLSQTSLMYGYVPIDEGERSNTWHLSPWSDYRTRRLRLTRREAEAVEAGVAACGLSPEMEEEYRRVRAAFWPHGASAEKNSALEEKKDGAWARQMLLIADAIAEDRSIRFSYQGLHDEVPRLRHALPRALFSRNGIAYVSAFDLSRKEMRQFHLGRMSGLTSEDATEGERAAAARAEMPMWFGGTERVCVRLEDPRALSFFNWEGLVELNQKNEDVCVISVPDLGGDWLARHVAAWADVAKTDDLGLSRRIAEWSRTRLQAK